MTVLTRQQYWGSPEVKEAEASGTAAMPSAADPDRTPASKDLKFIPKSAHVTVAPTGVVLQPVAGTQAVSNPQSRVNVEGKEAPRHKSEKTASRFALISINRYPLDSYSDVEKAAAYFGEWRNQFSPAQRHEYCGNLVKRAAELGVKVSDDLAKYGSETYAPASELELGIFCRQAVVDQAGRDVLSKLAEERGQITPELYAATLEEFDKTAGIEHLYDRGVLDPFYSTYGVKVAEDSNGSYVLGNDVIMYSDLLQLAQTTCAGMKNAFGDDFVKEFRKDPIAIFESLPVDQKRVVGRMAGDVLIHY